MAIITRIAPAVLLAAGILPGQGQGQMPQTLGEVPQQYMDLLRSDVRTKKKQIVRQVVGLSEEEGAKFWPLHEAYEKELDALQSERLKLLQDYEQKWGDLSEAQVTTYMNRLMDLRLKRDKLLQKYIDRPIVVDQVRGQGTESFAGTLLSTHGGLVLRRDDGSVQILPHNAGIKLPSLPGGLITRPTLLWDVNAQRAGSHRTRVSYQTQGMTWWADYNVAYAEGAQANGCALDIGACPYGNWSGRHAVSWEMHAPEFGEVSKSHEPYRHSYPLSIMINAEGKRFVDEGADFYNYTYAKYGAEVLEQTGQFAWQVFDAKVRKLLRPEYDGRNVTRVVAGTLEELAATGFAC